MKKFLLLMIFPLFLGTGHAMGKKAPEGVSLLLVPSRPAMIQLGMDMAAGEHALLMSYAPGTSVDNLFLHLWDGSKWMRVPQSSYKNGSFIRNPASRLLVVGEESKLTAALIETALNWSPEVLHLGTDNVTELINQMGRLYGFNKADWQWIAERYDLRLENLNRDREKSSWYDSNKASNLDPSEKEKPWKKNQKDAPLQTPETSLSPVMPPVTEAEPPQAEEEKAEAGKAAEEMKDEQVSLPGETEETPVGFSLEVE